MFYFKLQGTFQKKKISLFCRSDPDKECTYVSTTYSLRTKYTENTKQDFQFIIFYLSKAV